MRQPLLIALCLLLAWPVTARADRASALGAKRRGDQLAKRGALAEATRAYRLAVKEDPTYVAAYDALATHYLRQRRYLESEKLLRSALWRLRRASRLWYNYAYTLRKLGKHSEAIRAYRAFAQLEPGSADPFYGMGLALRATGQHAEAARAFRRYAAMERSPARRSWVEKARVMAAKLEGKGGASAKPGAKAQAPAVAVPGRVTQVKESGASGGAAPRKEAVEEKATTPERVAAMKHKQRGDALVAQRRHTQAVYAYRRAISADYSYTAAYNELGHALFSLGRHADAVKVFRIAIRDNPEYKLGWYNLGYALRRAGRLREAVAAYHKFAKLRPKDPDPHYGLGLAYRAIGDKPTAIRSFSRYVTLEARATHKKWVARAKETIKALGGTPPTAIDRTVLVPVQPAPKAAKGARGGAWAKRVKEPAPTGALPPDVFAKALSAATGKTAPKAAPKPETKAEKRRRERMERKRKREEAREARARKRRQAAEDRRLARLERQRKRKAAKAERLRKRKEAAEKRKQARLERKRQKEEARRAHLAAKRGASPTPAAKSGVATVAPAVVPTRVSTIVAPPTGTKPEPDRPASIPPPARPVGSGSSGADKLRVQGDSLARIAKCGGAIALYRQALAKDPFLTSAYHGFAYCAQRLSKYQGAIAALRMGLRDNPDYHAGWLHLARLRDTAGDGAGAVGSYRKYLRAKPGDADARFELARVLRHAGLKAQAVAEYQRYLRRERRKERAPRRAAAYQELKGMGVAVAVAPSVPAAPARASTPPAAKAKSLPPEIFSKALAAAKGEPLKAVTPRPLSAAEKRRRARERRAEDRRLAQLERQRKRKEAAEKRKQARLEKVRSRKEAAEKRKQARLEKVRLRKEAAEKRKQARLEKARQRAAAAEKRRQARLERLRQRKEAAEKRRQARLERLQGIKDARKRKAQERLERRRAARERAREDRMLARLARKGRKKSAAPPSKAEKLLRGVASDLDSAAKAPPVAGSALRPASDAAQGLVDVADAQFGKQRYVVALGVYRHAARLDPASTEPLYKAGVCAVALRQMHLAAQLFAKVLQIDPANQIARTNMQMARAAARSSKPSESYRKEARQLARRSVAAGHYARAERQLNALLGHGVNADLYALRARARLGLRRSRAALRDAGRALALAPGDPGALRLIGRAHRQAGDRARALYYYRLFVARTEGDASRAAERREVEAAITELAGVGAKGAAAK